MKLDRAGSGTLVLVIAVGALLATLAHTRGYFTLPVITEHFGNLYPEEPWYKNPKWFIAHGGGAIGGHEVTDSKEAVLESIRRGYRMIELDLLTTTDGYIVAAHDWRSFRERTGEALPRDDPMSLSEFLQRRIDQQFSPLDESAIREIFMNDSTLVLVTDKIRDFNRLAQAFPFQDRLIVEVFSGPEVHRARSAGIRNPMLSIGDLESSIGLVERLAIQYVAVNISEIERCPEASARLIDQGRLVFAYTSNDVGQMARHVRLHASRFYTDHWHVAEGRCTGPGCRAKAH